MQSGTTQVVYAEDLSPALKVSREIATELRERRQRELEETHVRVLEVLRRDFVVHEDAAGNWSTRFEMAGAIRGN